MSATGNNQAAVAIGILSLSTHRIPHPKPSGALSSPSQPHACQNSAAPVSDWGVRDVCQANKLGHPPSPPVSPIPPATTRDPLLESLPPREG